MNRNKGNFQVQNDLWDFILECMSTIYSIHVPMYDTGNHMPVRIVHKPQQPQRQRSENFMFRK